MTLSEPTPAEQVSGRGTWLFWLIAVGFLLKSLFTVFSIPLGQSPDEESHADYVNWLLERGTPPHVDDHLSLPTVILYAGGFPPVKRDAPAEGPARIFTYRQAEIEHAKAGYAFDSVEDQAEAGQPPLYYATAAFLTGPFRSSFGIITHWQMSRLVSVLFGLITLGAAWWVGMRLFEGEPLVFRALPCLVMALHPMVGYITAMVNNDGALIALSAVFVALVMTGRDPRLTALVLALLLLTKASALALVPWWLWWCARPLWESDRERLSLCFLIAFVPILAWLAIVQATRGMVSYVSFVQDVFLQVDSPVAWGTFLPTWLSGVTGELWLQFGGIMGWLARSMPPWWQALRGVLAVGVLVFAARGLKGAAWRAMPAGDRQVVWQSVSFCVLWWLLLAYGGWRAMEWCGNHTLQGRMALPCLLPAMLGMGTIMRRLAPASVRTAWTWLTLAGTLMASAHMVLVLPARLYFEAPSPVYTMESIGVFARGIAACQSMTLNAPGPWQALVAALWCLYGVAIAAVGYHGAGRVFAGRGGVAVRASGAVILLLLAALALR